ncbi:MAG: signal peptide peptidase SppA [Sutterella sp.]|nr:signal peptide peptidase SppA [Sutterella sp.]
MLSRLLQIGRLFDGLRRVILNLFFFGIILTILVWGWMNLKPIEVEQGTLLRVDIAGSITEAGSDAPQIRFLSAAGVEKAPVTRLRDVLDALRAAKSDPRIAGVVLMLDQMDGAGMAAIREIGAAIDDYRRTSGKKVWVWDSSYTQAQYLIAAHADHAGVHPMGDVILKGLSSTSLYWGSVMSRLGIDVEVRRAGAFKSAPEILTSEKPSAENLAAQKIWMDEAWKGISADLENRRGLIEGSVQTLLKKLPEAIKSERTLPLFFLENGLIDALETREEFENALAVEYTATGKPADLKVVDSQDYLSAYPELPLAEPGVAVVIAEGEILSAPGMGGMTPEGIGALIDEAEQDPNVRALVVRVNSPGGDALAAEMIRARLESFKKVRQIPVVISMGDAAASGGYWIATAGDRIIADPFSVTGSIGVFAMSFHAETLRGRLGIGRGGYRTTPLADLGNPAAAPSELEMSLIDGGVNRTYRDFKRFVCTSRNMKDEDVERVAQGRVWMGSQAVKFGLADAEGGYYDAVSVAKKLAGLSDEAGTAVYEPETGGWRSVMLSLLRASLGETAVRLLNEEAAFSALLSQSGRPAAWAPFAPKL